MDFISEIKVRAYDVMSLHWMARRYADGRSSYSPGLFNGVTRRLIAAGVDLKHPLFARDGMGRQYDGLTDEEAQAAEDDMPRGFVPEPDGRLASALEALRQIAEHASGPLGGVVNVTKLSDALATIARDALAVAKGENGSPQADGMQRSMGEKP